MGRQQRGCETVCFQRQISSFVRIVLSVRLSNRNWIHSNMRALKSVSSNSRRTQGRLIDYPLQGSKLDLPLEAVLAFTPKQRQRYTKDLLAALGREIRSDTMALKKRVSFAREMR